MAVSAFPVEGLSAYWPLDEITGVRADIFNVTDLAPYNAVGAVAGRVNGAADFLRASGSRLSCPSVPPIKTGNVDFTVTAWIRPASTPGGMIVGKQAGFIGRDYLIDVSPTQRARFSCSRETGATAVEGAPITVGAWQYLIAWHDAAAGTISVQVNDGPAATVSTAGVKPNVTAAQFNIGGAVSAPPEDCFDGAIDEVGFWKRILTPAERTALYNGGLGLAYPGREPPAPPPDVPAPPLVMALRARLLTRVDVTAIVDQRIYTLEFPQSLTAPALRLQEIDRVSTMQLRGDVAIRRARVQIDAVESRAHDDPYTTAHRLAAAVRGDLTRGAPSGLVGFRGVLSRIPIAGILADDQRERYDAETQFVRIEQDFIVWFQS